MSIRHKVVQGECISSIAFRNGFAPDTLWAHPENVELQEKRSDPNALLPGDIVVIPDKTPETFTRMTGKRHTFQRRGVPEKLKVQFLKNGEPRANEPFELDIDGVITKGTTTGDGKLDVWIDPAARLGTITFTNGGATYPLKLGHLDPVEEITGVQARLANLGLYQGPIDGELNGPTEAAIHLFQQREKIETESLLDEQTCEALENAYHRGGKVVKEPKKEEPPPPPAGGPEPFEVGE